MKRYWRKSSQSTDNGRLSTVVSGLLTIALLIAFGCSQNKKHTHAEQYTCSMHPTVIQDKPGTCPICGMELVLKEKQNQEVKITDELNYLLKPVNSTIISSIKTIAPVRKSMNIKVNANGIITYDTRTFSAVSSRISGRIKKLFVKYNFQSIRKGQRILEIYSPDLLTAQRDLLYLLKSDKENVELIERAKEKLKLLGATETQINRLITKGEESTTFGVYSPEEGYVINSSENPSNQNELDVREGMYVAEGQLIFKVVKARNVWAEFDLYSKDAALVKVNDPIQIKTEGTEALDQKVNFVEPFYKEGQNFTKVRVYLSGSKYRVGQLVSASFDKQSQGSMWIPLSAQIDLGTKKIAFIKGERIFRPKEIITGNQSDNWIEVLKGIDAGDSIAYDAHFLVDSEGFIKIKK